MKSTYAEGLSQQAVYVYKKLLKGKVLTAKELGDALHISPTSIYRIALHLKRYGLIEITNDFPQKFIAIDMNKARENFLLLQRNWFVKMFQTNNDLFRQSAFDVSFFQSREEALEKCTEDVRLARKKVRFFILALKIGVPAEFLYEWKKAVERGVDIKMLIQEFNEENKEMLYYWKHTDINIRHSKPFGWHLFLIDDDISYIMMYDQKDKSKRLAVRFVHPQINNKLQVIFNNEWQKSRTL